MIAEHYIIDKKKVCQGICMYFTLNNGVYVDLHSFFCFHYSKSYQKCLKPTDSLPSLSVAFTHYNVTWQQEVHG